jgi:hypothetical protein
VGSKNSLDKLELEAARDYEKNRQRRRRKDTELKRKTGANTRIGKGVGKRGRKPPPVPAGKTLSEIRDMPPESEDFRHRGQGRPRRWENPDGTPKTKPANWKDEIRAAHQRKTNAKRARTRKWEAEVVVAQHTLAKHTSDDLNDKGIYDEDKLIAEAVLDLEEWDNEELIRGYKRNRNGRFGKAPAYIPREIQQEAFRRLIGRGERKMKVAYLEAVEALIKLAHDADSEKVKLDAIKTLMERVVGKVPDVVRVSQEAPWEAMLADAIVPLSEALPLELTPGDDGTYALEPMSEGEVETPTAEAAQRDPTTGKAPSPSRRSSKTSKKKSK